MTNTDQIITVDLGDHRYRYNLNVTLFQRGMDRITYHPEGWYQGTWLTRVDVNGELLSERPGGPACGTAGCLAGTVALLAGGSPDFEEYMPNTGYVVVPEDGSRYVLSYATELLGLPYELAEKLFDASNSLAELWDMADRFSDGNLTIPPADVIARAQEISDRLYDS